MGSGKTGKAVFLGNETVVPPDDNPLRLLSKVTVASTTTPGGTATVATETAANGTVDLSDGGTMIILVCNNYDQAAGDRIWHKIPVDLSTDAVSAAAVTIAEQLAIVQAADMYTELIVASNSGGKMRLATVGIGTTSAIYCTGLGNTALGYTGTAAAPNVGTGAPVRLTASVKDAAGNYVAGLPVQVVLRTGASAATKSTVGQVQVIGIGTEGTPISGNNTNTALLRTNNVGVLNFDVAINTGGQTIHVDVIAGDTDNFIATLAAPTREVITSA